MAVTLGNFDGVHRGHQALVGGDGRLGAGRVGGRRGPHLRSPSRPDPEPEPGQGRPHDPGPEGRGHRVPGRRSARGAALHRASWRAWPRRSSRGSCCAGALGASRVVVGQDFRFGRGRAGDVAALTELGRSLGFTVRGLLPVLDDGVPVSSSRIRDRLAEGDVAKAGALLGRALLRRRDGRPRRWAGTQPRVPDREPRGAERDAASLRGLRLPGPGGRRSGLLARGGQPRPEADLRRRGAGARSPPAGFRRAISTAQEARVEFVERLRAERTFSGGAALLEQIRTDAAAARRVLEKP